MWSERSGGVARRLVLFAAVLGCGSSGSEADGPPGIATAVSAGATAACAVVSGGVQCWGDNNVGNLDNSGRHLLLVPIRITGLATGVTAVAVGGPHACAVVGGAAECWGTNRNGQLGDGSTTDSPIPVPVSGLSSGVSALSASSYYTCAIVSGALACWGDNSGTQLGTKDPSVPHPTPIAVDMFPSGVTAITTAGDSACAVMNGAAFCWGGNSNGHLGAGYSVTPYGPVPVDGLGAGVSAISAGGYHSCAVVDGGAWCWGWNSSGQIGNSSVPVPGGIAWVPVPVDGLSTGVTAISAGGGATCAIVNGGVWCWGGNARGELGNDSMTDSPLPAPVHGLETGATAISVGGPFACAVVDGGVRCWGDNSLGELGDGSQRGSLVPVGVRAPALSRAPTRC